MESDRDFNVFVQGCPSREIMQRLGDKWTPLVLLALAGGPLRFSALRQRIGAVTPKVLTSTLRTLERDGLLLRTVTAQVPVRVDYELSEVGRSLLGPLEAIRLWSEEHVPGVLRARDEFDRARHE
ncbi:winged helix-turn-helix transcriptional regulator [Glutamicibacter protophormiae]|uniref:winged helix-turn-helix transcriptional regulator n=1 Tax=Glutamicibacter protophormiae TaxID=37930 RepID=UPI0019562CE8|nr:helix-turn-helix domain-containing protein [Glutamicibacter protophormiae]QRQ78102.1 helix-turn-helix transcriptional regulator [Glutamicibacter protophormiae]